jgi:hypothetical protein
MTEPQPLTPEEIAKLRALLPVAEIVRQEAEYQAAWRLVLTRWKAVIVWLAAFIAAVIVIWNAAKHGWQSFTGG